MKKITLSLVCSLIVSAMTAQWVSGVELIPNQDSCINVAYSKVAFYPGPQDSANRIFMNKVTKNGIKLRGEEGIQVSESTACFSYSPVLLNTEDNQVCIGYEVIDSVDSPFGPPVDSAYGYISLRKSGADESVLFFMKKVNNDNEDVFSYANKCGTDGTSIWGKTVLLSNRKGTIKGLKPLEEIGNQWVVSFSDYTDTAYSNKARGQLYAQNLLLKNQTR